MLETSYDQHGEERKEAAKLQKEIESNKGLINFYGYKHKKATKFYAYLMRCLKDCYEAKFEQLNVDMNFFLLLKNELSLAFLRNNENILATIKTAIRIHASEQEK